MEWFTVEKIDNKTFAISEYKHWEQMHSYLLIGDEYALLIDSGLGIGNIKDQVDKLTDLPVKVVSTHVHWDHIGGHKHFEDIYVHQGDLDWLENGLPIPIEFIKKDVVKDVKVFPTEFCIGDYEVFKGKPKNILKDNDIVDIGGRKIKVIHTPGHSPGHICLYDLDNDYLFSGDLVYEGTLFAFYPSTNPKEYKESVKRLLSYNNIKKLLPAHNSLDVSPGLINKIYDGFVDVESKCNLNQGSGIFDFDDFKIHI